MHRNYIVQYVDVLYCIILTLRTCGIIYTIKTLLKGQCQAKILVGVLYGLICILMYTYCPFSLFDALATYHVLKNRHFLVTLSL